MFVSRVNSRGDIVSCEASLSRSHWDRLAGCSRSGCLSQQFPDLIRSKQYKCVPFLTPDPITACGFLPTPSISTAETYYCVINEVALAPDLFSQVHPFQFCFSLFIYCLSSVQMCMSEVTCLQRFYNYPLDVCFLVISQQTC